MTIRNEIDFLKAQLLDIQRLLKMIAAHPLMGEALACRERELRERLCMEVGSDKQHSESSVN